VVSNDVRRSASKHPAGSKYPAAAALPVSREVTVPTMPTRQLLTLADTRSPASEELRARVAARAELDERLDALERQQRQSSEEVARLSAELAQLEREAAGGKQVSAAQRTKAEQALTKARLRSGEPWSERYNGVHAAQRDADRALNAFRKPCRSRVFVKWAVGSNQ
jgi:hypothetical protein